MNVQDLKILKLFFLLEKTYNFDDMFRHAGLDYRRKRLIRNNDLAVFGDDENRYHIMLQSQSVLIVNCDRISGKIVNVSFKKYEGFSKLNQVYDEIYEAALEHNFLHEIGKFH